MFVSLILHNVVFILICERGCVNLGVVPFDSNEYAFDSCKSALTTGDV